MATKKRKTKKSPRSEKRDAHRLAKPAGARFKGKGNLRRPTAAEKAADKKKPKAKRKIYTESRVRHSDKNKKTMLRRGGKARRKR